MKTHSLGKQEMVKELFLLTSINKSEKSPNQALEWMRKTSAALRGIVSVAHHSA